MNTKAEKVIQLLFIITLVATLISLFIVYTLDDVMLRVSLQVQPAYISYTLISLGMLGGLLLGFLISCMILDLDKTNNKEKDNE